MTKRFPQNILSPCLRIIAIIPLGICLMSCGPNLKSMSSLELFDRGDDEFREGYYKNAAEYYAEYNRRGASYFSLYRLGVSYNKTGHYEEAVYNFESAVEAWDRHTTETLIQEDIVEEFRFDCYSGMVIAYRELESAKQSPKDLAIDEGMSEKLKEAQLLKKNAKKSLDYWREHPEEVKGNFEEKLLAEARSNSTHVQVGWKKNNIKALYGPPDSLDDLSNIGGNGAEVVTVNETWSYYFEVQSGFVIQINEDTDYARKAYSQERPPPPPPVITQSNNSSLATTGSYVQPYNPYSVWNPEGANAIDLKQVRRRTLEIWIDNSGNVIGWRESWGGYRFSDGVVP